MVLSMRFSYSSLTQVWNQSWKDHIKSLLWAFVAGADLGQLLNLSKYLESLGYTQISLLELIMINYILQGLCKMLSDVLLDSKTPREVVT